MTATTQRLELEGTGLRHTRHPGTGASAHVPVLLLHPVLRT